MADGTVSLPRQQHGQGAILCSSLPKDSLATSFVVKDVGNDETKRSEKESRMRFGRKMAQYTKKAARLREHDDCIWDFDIKQGGGYFNWMYAIDLTKIDLDEECPKRGLALISEAYIETNLKIKDDEGQVREFSEGLLTIRGIARRDLDNCAVERVSLATMLSTVEVMYGFLIMAVEGTVAVQVMQGDFFDGQITAYTTSIANNRLVLYDRELYVSTSSDDGKGVIQLMRPVVCVSLSEMLVIAIKTRDVESERTITFTPKVKDAEEDEITVGNIKMRVKVTLSVMDN